MLVVSIFLKSFCINLIKASFLDLLGSMTFPDHRLSCLLCLFLPVLQGSLTQPSEPTQPQPFGLPFIRH